MSGPFLDERGLGTYDSAIKDKAAGSATIAGRTITLSSVSGKALSTVTVPETVIANATTKAAGLMSAADKTKLDGVTEGATKVADSTTNGAISINGVTTTVYTHPTGKKVASGLYKVTTDAYGHVTAATSVVKSDITGLGIPAQDTTYSPATSSTNGLMTSTEHDKLAGVASGAQVNVIESVSVNGVALSVNSKGVNVDLSAYALKSQVTSALHYKGSKDSLADIEAITDAEVGDMWNASATDMNYVYNGESWDPMAGVVTIESISDEYITGLFS